MFVLWCGCEAPMVPDGPVEHASESTQLLPPTTETVGDSSFVDSLLANALSLDTVLLAVAWSDGWPIRTDHGTFLFIREGEVDGFGVAGPFSDWQPAAFEPHAGFGLVELAVDDDQGAVYKFTDGVNFEADPWARSYDYDENGEISLVRPSAETARLDRWPDVPGISEGLPDRDLAVYVPAGSGPWPVLYAMDGQNLFDPLAVWGGWHLQDALVSVAPVLVVGITNTADRFDEYTHVADDIGYAEWVGGRASAYTGLVEAVIRPHIESTYGSTGVDGLMGSSLGGLVALYIAAEDPSAWDYVASLSGTLGWGRFAADGPVMEELWVPLGPNGVVVYADSGGGPGADGICQDQDGDGFPEDDPDAADNYCTNRQFVDALAAAGFTWDVDLFHWWEADAPHNEIAWGARVEVPLAQFAALSGGE